ncbi:hypothetical protein RJ639_001181 [Escallonia herrerae]|uniref:Multiple inositol polyphosphate phosphatase 1 n=1 Tax=Escallonia herrerae TaxID=1293975 RepID=A0AA88XHM8_9ASTE|nr:hypothetical protein RJ639_001181 [Escallonia herrerae]
MFLLQARHGTRAPTKKKMRELEALSLRLGILLQNAKEQKVSLQKLPSWLWGWKSPWEGKVKGGELISQGEEEMYNLGIRIRESFSQLFSEEYHPDVYPIKATQNYKVQSRQLFLADLTVNVVDILGLTYQFNFVLHILVRMLKLYYAFRKSQEPVADKLKKPVLEEITHALVKHYELNFTQQDTSSLWFLCKQEAALLNITDQACALFSPSEVSSLEWADDLEMFVLKGYGNSLNYRMGVPLLEDVIQSMEQAIKALEEEHAPGSYEKARLRFAHAETLVPFSCLLGLFLDRPEFELIQREQPLQLPPKPPQRRKWRGSIVAPFGGNNILVLYSCPANNASKYFVQVLHNEHPVPMPEKIGAPHLKHKYDAVCNVKMESSEHKSLFSKLLKMLRGLFLPSNDETLSNKVEL